MSKTGANFECHVPAMLALPAFDIGLLSDLLYSGLLTTKFNVQKEGEKEALDVKFNSKIQQLMQANETK